MKISDKIVEKCREEFFQIEQRTDITDDQKVTQLINITASVCAGVAVQPIPFGDVFILTPIQAFLGTRIAKVRGIPVSQNTALQSIKEIGSMVGIGLGAQQLVIGLYKFIPYWGSMTTIPVVYGMTYAIGRALDMYFTKKSLNQHIDPESLKRVFSAAKKEGKRKEKEKSTKLEYEKYSQEFRKVDYESKAVVYLKTNFDELIIITSLQSTRSGFELTENDEIVLSAFNRYSGRTHDIDSTVEYLNQMTEDQLVGVASNVKGILHEMEFVRIKNTDGDEITAALFPDTNHKGYDVVLNDKESGDSWEIQLKTTEDSGPVREWMEKYPDGEILVSEEMAGELGIESSGFSNEELTMRVESFVDKLLTEGQNSSILYFIPTLSLLSITLSVLELNKRRKSGDISYDEFKGLSIKVSGIKIAKFSILITMLTIPALNVVVGAALLAKVIYALVGPLSDLPKFKIPESLSANDLFKKRSDW